MSERPHLDIIPGVNSGRPVLAGTTLATSDVALWWWESAVPFEQFKARTDEPLTREGVILACWYEWFLHQGRLLPSQVGWLWNVDGLVEAGRYDEVPLPPQRRVAT